MFMERKASKPLMFSVRQITNIGMLSAISIILGSTPLGIIPVPPLGATIMHIPVIIGAILEGPLVGSMIGLIFGVFSLIKSITNPTSPAAFVFMNPIISILPRMLIGVTSYYAYKILKLKSDSIRIGLGALIGSFTNTIGVLSLIALIYLQRYAEALNMSVPAAKNLILSIAGLSGVPEAAISVLVTVPVVLIAKKIKKSLISLPDYSGLGDFLKK
jgi:uncharacterized membrane protein